ncbi:MAG: hypothetical protein ABIR18_14175 [Chitinophagaceae bacterium]
MQDDLANNKTPRQLLPAFYQQYNLDDDGGQSSSYVRIEFTEKFFLYFPNFDTRRKAVFKHDVHHIATGYTSTFKGETEISAWELASGCKRYWAAYALDLHAVMIGMLFNPAGVYKAFIKGRNTRNLYADIFTDEQLIDMPLHEIKDSLRLNDYSGKEKGSFIDWILFVLMLLLGVIYSISSLVLLPFVLVYTAFILIKNRK